MRMRFLVKINMLDLSIIIVNYNTKVFLRNCLKSIIENISNKISYEVVIVDNASTDGSQSEILNIKNLPAGRQGQILNLKTILNNKNLGFSKANNQGIKNSSNSRYVLFLNPDTILQKGVAEEMIAFMDIHKNAGASTCKVILPSGELDDASHRGFPTPWNAFCYFSKLQNIFPKSKFFAGYTLGWKNLTKTHEIDVLAGACMLVRREAGEGIGWWDEDYFFYGEDIEFCYQLKQRDWKIYYFPKVSVMHYKGVSGGIKRQSKDITTATVETKRIASRWRFNAMRIFYNKHYKKKYPRLVSFLVNAGINFVERFAKV